MKTRFEIFAAVLLLCLPAAAFEWGLKGQASAWGVAEFRQIDQARLGARYLPEVAAHQPLKKTALDAVVSLNFSADYNAETSTGASSAQLYRAWLRLSSGRWEARIGMQKLDFGAAMLLRPLMWFDSLDPRDPLQLTSGVTGAMARYVFPNNANIRAWGLLGDDKIKGLEIFPSVERSLEYGGRVQYPTPRGEIAVTAHHRRVSPQGSLFTENSPFAENRYAVDGKWDLGVGLWLEAALVQPQQLVMSLGDQKLLTVGLDCTFGIGNGLHTLAEHMIVDLEINSLFGERRTDFSGLLADYGLSVWDQFSAIFLLNHNTRDLWQFYTWRRTYDHWAFNVSVFNNPQTAAAFGLGSQNASAYRSQGVQLMIVYNH